MCDVTPVLAMSLFLRKTNGTFVTHFGNAVRGKGTPNIASIGHSVLGNDDIRYDTGLTLRFLHKYMPILLPPFYPFGVAVRSKATFKMLVSPYSGT